MGMLLAFEEATDAGKHLVMHRTGPDPQQRIILPHISIVTRLRNSDLGLGFSSLMMVDDLLYSSWVARCICRK